MQELQVKIETREPLIIENRGQRIFAVLHRPVGVTNPPVVCTFHGFASNKLGSNRSYVHLAEALSKAGIATLRFDFRGSGDSEGSMGDVTIKEMVSDGKCVLQFLEKIEGIDRKRVGIFGSSLGGSIAILTQKHVSYIKTMVLWAPVASGRLWYQDILRQNPALQNKDPSLAFENFRGFKIHPQFRAEFANMYAEKEFRDIDFPVLHMHGDADVTISVAHQEAFREHAAKNVRFITYSEAEHRLGHLAIFPQIVKESTAWFVRTFNGREEPSRDIPSKI